LTLDQGAILARSFTVMAELQLYDLDKIIIKSWQDHLGMLAWLCWIIPDCDRSLATTYYVEKKAKQYSFGKLLEIISENLTKICAGKTRFHKLGKIVIRSGIYIITKWNNNTGVVWLYVWNTAWTQTILANVETSTVNLKRNLCIAKWRFFKTFLMGSKLYICPDTQKNPKRSNHMKSRSLCLKIINKNKI